VKELVSGLRDSAADHHDFRVEDVDEARHRRTQQPGGLVHDVERPFVAVVCGFVDNLGGDLGEIALHILRQRRLDARLDPFDRTLGDRRSGGVRLDAAVVAAFAAAPVGIDRDVPEFPRDVGHPVVDLAVDDDPTTNPCAERETNDVVRAARGAAPPLAEDGAIGVVIERCGKAQPLAHSIAERHVRPAEVGREQHHAALRVQGPRRADPHSLDFLACLDNARLRELDDAGGDGVRALGRYGRLRDDTVNLGAVLSEDSGDEIRPPNVNPDDVAHQVPRWPRSRPQQ